MVDNEIIMNLQAVVLICIYTPVVKAENFPGKLCKIDTKGSPRIKFRIKPVFCCGFKILCSEFLLIPVLEPLLGDLRRAGFHMSDELYDQVLDSAGEER